MCGRFALFSPPAEIAAFFNLNAASLENMPPPSYNLAPGSKILALGKGRRPCAFTWGLIPFRSPGAAAGRMIINVRGETLERKPLFRQAARQRRCLVPANVFYEWQATAAGGRQPYLVRPRHQRLLAMAAIWEPEEKKAAPASGRCAIITLPAVPALQTVHHRMPAVVARENFALWLDPQAKISDLDGLLRQNAGQDWEVYPVSSRGNIPANNDAELLRPLPAAFLPERRMKLWDT